MQKYEKYKINCIKKQCICLWINEHNKELNRLNLLREHTIKYKKKILINFKEYLLKCTNWKRISNNIKKHKEEKLRLKTFEGLVDRLNYVKDKAKKVKKSQVKASNTLGLKVMNTLHKMIEFRFGSEEAIAYNIRKQVRTFRKHKVKHHMLQVWKSKAQVAMRRAKAATMFTKQFKKIFLNIWFSKYRTETQFLKYLHSLINTSTFYINVHFYTISIED